MSTTNTNGHVARKTLASQLDRLDSIIDALANGLNETVADVVKQAVTVAVSQTVEAVMREVLSRPELLRQLAAEINPPTATVAEPKPAQPSKLVKALSWVGSKIANAGRWVGTKVSNGWTVVCNTLRRLPLNLQGLRQKIREVLHRAWELRRPVLASLLIGIGTGCIGYLAGPVMSSLTLGLCVSALSLTAFLITPFMRLWKSMQTETA